MKILISMMAMGTSWVAPFNRDDRSIGTRKLSPSKDALSTKGLDPLLLLLFLLGPLSIHAGDAVAQATSG